MSEISSSEVTLFYDQSKLYACVFLKAAFVFLLKWCALMNLIVSVISLSLSVFPLNFAEQLSLAVFLLHFYHIFWVGLPAYFSNVDRFWGSTFFVGFNTFRTDHFLAWGNVSALTSLKITENTIKIQQKDAHFLRKQSWWK